MAKCKVLALIDKDPKLLEPCERIQERKAQFEQKMEFIKKQAENAYDEMKRNDEPDWELITDRLKETEALSSINKDTHFLSFSLESNAVELIEKSDDEHPLARLFRGLF